MSHIIRLTVIVVVALTVISCNEKRNKKQANNNAQQTEQSHPTLKGVDFKAPEYLSQDLAMQDLGGRVKSMQNTFYVCNPSGLKVEDEMGDEHRNSRVSTMSAPWDFAMSLAAPAMPFQGSFKPGTT